MRRGEFLTALPGGVAALFSGLAFFGRRVQHFPVQCALAKGSLVEAMTMHGNPGFTQLHVHVSDWWRAHELVGGAPNQIAVVEHPYSENVWFIRGPNGTVFNGPQRHRA